MANSIIGLSKILYTVKNATQLEIYDHLIKCDANFIPPLSSKVTIQDYAKKIFDKSVTFEAWSDGVLVGLIAVYFNDPTNIAGYITSVSVLANYMGMGIARDLLKFCCEYAEQNGFDEIALEVNCANRSAIHLYKKFDFLQIGIKDGFIQMKVSGLRNFGND